MNKDNYQYYENQKTTPIHLPLKIGDISHADHHENNCSDETPPSASNLSTENTVSTENFIYNVLNFFSRHSKNPTTFSKDNKKVSSCQSSVKSHQYSISLSEKLIKNYETKKDFKAIGSYQGSKESLNSKNHKLTICHTVGEIRESDLIEKKENYKSSSGSSTPHLYTDYKPRLHNLLLKNFGNYDENENDTEILADVSRSLSNNSDY
ncbi:hypothetical protein SteCoe_9034 [Stentor coeruleus]|uniref:Uncharacterized protein n=1 Tax=Stentor coeruleus TaxID=5963 RepID=A0A1R2CIU5_9CILI|nr:hypothetical protein SteCoe_9034 [Stentor coeruleus]